MNKLDDLTSKTFGKWLVIYRAENYKNGATRWHCKCECGKEKDVLAAHLKGGKSKSCGCNNYKNLNPYNGLKHGLSHSKIHDTWTHMKSRCSNLKDKNYKNYGGRGIEVCEDWNEFENFYEWSMNNGFDQKLSLDRINNDGNYEPSNCRWTTRKVQQNNTRHNRLLTIKGETKTFIQWCEFIGISQHSLYCRIKNGWSEEEILSKPSTKRRKRSKQVSQIYLDKIYKTYKSMSEASRITGIAIKDISLCCNNKRHTAGGYKWTFKVSRFTEI